MKLKSAAAIFILLMSFVSAVFAGGEHEAAGTVNSVDKAAKTINISHGPIKTMGMGAMTMDFLVADPYMLSEVKPGQNIKFVVTTDSKGRFVILDLQ